MEKFPLNLHDLVPREMAFNLSTIENELHLCRWSLRVRAWATAKYTPEGLRDIFEKQQIEEIADMVWFMLKDDDKKLFGNEKNVFLDNVVTMQDQINIIKALLGSVGIGEPEIKQISKSMEAAGVKVETAEKADPADPKSKAPKKKIGAKSSTP